MKPLTDMTGSELLDEFSVLIHKLAVSPDAPEMAARRFALRGELLRRLAVPVISPEPKCPECGHSHIWFTGLHDMGCSVTARCNGCGNNITGTNLHDFAQFFTSKAEGEFNYRSLAEQIFFHVLLKGGEGNPFRSIKSEWFIDLAAPRLQELLAHWRPRPLPSPPKEG